MKANYIVLAAICSLTIIQITAMGFGINGTLRSIIIMVIAGLAGWRIPMNGKSIKVKTE